MSLLNEIKGHETFIKNDGLMIKVNNRIAAFELKNKIERTGYSVDYELNGDGKYVVKVWGVHLMDLYLRKGLAK